MPTTTLSGVYVSEFQQENLQDIYTVDSLRSYQKQRSEKLGLKLKDSKAMMFNLVIVVGQLNDKDAQHLNFCIHQLLIEEVLIINDEQPSEEAKQYYPMINWSNHTISLNDFEGMAVDIAKQFTKMPNPKFNYKEVVKEFPGKFNLKDLQNAS